MTGRRPLPDDPLEPLRSPQWLTEARRKAIHLSFIVLPIELLFEWLPWPRTQREFRVLFLALTAGAVLLDVLRIHESRVRTFFRQFFGEMIREHERMSLLGSTYLLLAALIAVEVFPHALGPSSRTAPAARRPRASWSSANLGRYDGACMAQSLRYQ